MVGNGFAIEIEDRGLGMSAEELVKVNQRLATPPDIDFALAKMLGFFVVTQLASKHGIKVQLRHSWYGGITALVLVPRALIVQPADHPPAPGDGRAPSADPDLDWIDSRVPMVHAPLRRPHSPAQPDQVPGAYGSSFQPGCGPRGWRRRRRAGSRPGSGRSGTGPGTRTRRSRSRCRSAAGPGTRAAC